MRSLIRNILPVLPEVAALCYNMPVLYDDWMRLLSKILPILSACQSESSSVVFMSSICRCTDMCDVCNWAEKSLQQLLYKFWALKQNRWRFGLVILFHQALLYLKSIKSTSLDFMYLYLINPSKNRILNDFWHVFLLQVQQIWQNRRAKIWPCHEDKGNMK